MSYRGRKTSSKLTELLMIVIILGLAAMSTVPQLSFGAQHENTAPADADLILLQNAINQYFGDHQTIYPGDTFALQLTMRSNAKGVTSKAKRADFPFGPYLHDGIPTQRQVGNNRVTVVSQRYPLTATPTTETGWLYNSFTGQIIANTPRR